MVLEFKSCIFVTAPMPGNFFCVLGPSYFLAAAILNYDVVVHCLAQAPVKLSKEEW